MASKTCLRCGSSVDESCNFCSSCGASLGGATAVAAAGAAPGGTIEKKQAPVEGKTAGLPHNVAALLCYIPFVTGILFLLIEPYNKDRFVRFHAFQSIFFFIGVVVVAVIASVVGGVLRRVFNAPWDYVVLTVFLSLVLLGLLFVWILLMYKAYRNEMFSLPVVGDLAARQA